MISLQINNRRLDITRNVKGYVDYHCYLLVDGMVARYIFKDNLLSALKFILYL